MKTKTFPIIASLILGVLLFSCGTKDTEIDVDAIRTEAVKTHIASQTEVLVILPTVTPTLTAEPSATPTVDMTATLEPPAAANPCYNRSGSKTVPSPTEYR